MPYPSTLTAYTNPLPTERLNSPSHSSIETAQNTGLTEIQTYIGVTTGVNASAVGTLLYDIKAPGSDGGGHVQTANKGGTGQTSFNKGDILVAQSSSVLTKLAVGSAGEVLGVNPDASTGVSWSSVLANKVAVNTGSVAAYFTSSVTTVLFATSVLGSVVGTSNAIRFKGYLSNLSIPGVSGITFVANYGVNSVASSSFRLASSLLGATGYIEGIVAGNGQSSQIGLLTISGSALVGSGVFNPQQYICGNIQGKSSVNSFAPQDLVITSRFNDDNLHNSIVTGAFVVDKIV